MSSILYGILVAVILTALVYAISSKLIAVDLNIIHIGALGCLFIFIAVQSFLFFAALEAKQALNEWSDSVNLIISSASDFVDSVKENTDAEKLANEYKPYFEMFGLNLENSDKSLKESIDALNDYFNVYIWKRVGWVSGAIFLYILASVLLTSKNKSKSTYSYGDTSSIDISDWHKY